jgi:hypothetical protein
MTNSAFDYAVQPAALGKTLDTCVCLWAVDLDHAYKLAKAFDGKAVIWKCPHHGQPMPWI